jgi:hypothetical protein
MENSRYRCVFLDNYYVIYEQRERVFHRDIQTLENNVWKHSRFALVFSYIVFSCLDIPVKHSLSLFIYYLQSRHSLAHYHICDLPKRVKVAKSFTQIFALYHLTVLVLLTKRPRLYVLRTFWICLNSLF